MEDSLKIDFKQFNDKDHRAELIRAEECFNQIVKWIRNGMNDSNDKSAAIIMFCNNQNGAPTSTTTMMCMGNGKSFMDSLVNGIKRNLKAAVKNDKMCVFEALRICGDILDSVKEVANSKEFDMLVARVLMLTLKYM